MELLIQPRIIFVNGCFDILHVGHLKLLDYAKSLGDILIVALDSDEKIRQAKPNRPINCLEDRLNMMMHIKPVDVVYSFASVEELDSLIENIQPDIMVVGSDWKDKPIIGSRHSKEVRFFERVPNYSTTTIIQSISNRRNL